MEKQKLCSYCNKESVCRINNEYGFIVEACGEHFDEIFYSAVDMGEYQFLQWAKTNYSNEKAIQIAKQVFGEEFSEEMENDEMVWLFAFGILKYPYNLKSDGAGEIIENCTVSGKVMYLFNNSFPITADTNNPKDLVYGTLAEIPKSTLLHHYDTIEGYNPNVAPAYNMYNRVEVDVTTPDGEVVKANMYIANPGHFEGWFDEKIRIKTGNFDDRDEVMNIRGKRRGWQQ